MTEGRQQSFNIRRFQPGDGEWVRELHERAMEDTPAYLPDIPDEDLHTIEESYLDTAGEFLVGVAGETVARWARTRRPTTGSESI